MIRQAEPDGFDAVFGSTGGDYLERGFWLLTSGGTFAGYGNPLSFSHMLHLK
ncbi:MAG: hypothetical protein M8353_06480 [ANME-2 cluster archaeon]|nr:hypothetical protein [ANME-2 cluster archaeon]